MRTRWALILSFVMSCSLYLGRATALLPNDAKHRSAPPSQAPTGVVHRGYNWLRESVGLLPCEELKSPIVKKAKDARGDLRAAELSLWDLREKNQAEKRRRDELAAEENKWGGFRPVLKDPSANDLRIKLLRSRISHNRLPRARVTENARADKAAVAAYNAELVTKIKPAVNSAHSAIQEALELLRNAPKHCRDGKDKSSYKTEIAGLEKDFLVINDKSMRLQNPSFHH